MTKTPHPHEGGSYVRTKDDGKLQRAAYTRQSHEAPAEQHTPDGPPAQPDPPRANRGKR
jgi:hypothetical protein